MTRRRKTTIITETDRVLVLNTKCGRAQGSPQDREESAGMVRLEQAAAPASLRLSVPQSGTVAVHKSEPRDWQ